MQSRFPHSIYNVYDKNTLIYALLSVYADKMDASTNIIDRLYAMIGIDSTYDEDLEHRWGSLLGVYKSDNESYRDYRSRLMIVYSSLAGGTTEAIKYAIASVVGISDNQELIDKYIHVYDAWKYDGSIDTSSLDTSYGHIICTVDITIDESISRLHDEVMQSINMVKASGIEPYLFFMYIVNDSATLHTNDIELDKIILADTDNIKTRVTDNTSDSIRMSTITDSVSAKSEIVGDMWSTLGTNTQLVLNENFVTNMLEETDRCIDIITYIGG